MRNDPEYWAVVCPVGGNHQIENREVIWIDLNPDHVVPERACIKCGLRDTHIEESE